MMKPLALDLCCGKGGWTIGLLAAGWDVIGVDIEQWDGYPDEATFIKRDVLESHGHMILAIYGRKISLIVASPPCQEFSYRSFPFKRCRELAATVPPDKRIWQACERIAKECNAPLVLENVRGAQKYMGKAMAHYGSFYLWGDVPAMLPIGRPIKGFGHHRNESGKVKGWKSGAERSREAFGINRTECNQSSNPVSRKKWSAQAAMIPFELAIWIGQCFKNSLENKDEI